LIAAQTGLVSPVPQQQAEIPLGRGLSSLYPDISPGEARMKYNEREEENREARRDEMLVNDEDDAA
jgi:hypothetical protein